VQTVHQARAPQSALASHILMLIDLSAVIFEAQLGQLDWDTQDTELSGAETILATVLLAPHWVD
jgi:hypothetical protein